ncbi:Abscission/NoCut checkpoint regulator [Colletotrichum chlorophyti]|uniref:Abscission/NoCut checkpoint regulator n=1 Tax=Colletotrichum chlorophyti TaxID=708187 RepID=A0A1Q8REV2_9PEZI|nr:Abscission/NoCut checkpoint regulator [Colletotrichum chlorophyti]
MSGPDKSLLDRLSALKGSSSGVSLDRSSNALDVSLTGIEPAKPASREDALAARLRSLRNTPEREVPSLPQQQEKSYPAKVLEETASLSPASPYRRSHSGTPPPLLQPQPQHLSSRSPVPGPTPVDDVDPLLQTDDQTLEDLLSDEDLALDSGAPHHYQWRFGPKTETSKVNALLEELSKASVAPHTPSQEAARESKGHVSQDDRDDDDSDGEEMSKEVENLLAQALEGAKLDSPPDVPNPPAPDRHVGHTGDASRVDHDGDGGQTLSLPPVPSTIAEPKTGDDGNVGGLSGLSLPSVPSGAPKHNPTGSDFDSDIVARMAALSGLGSSSPDGIGLPSVPTFQPADRPVKRLTSRTAYNDEDAETWCTVCLEDATLRCLGCEDVYCTRCWHEMHVGPAAAFDDRTHKAVQFARPKKEQQRKVALGAS